MIRSNVKDAEAPFGERGSAEFAVAKRAFFAEVDRWYMDQGTGLNTWSIQRKSDEGTMELQLDNLSVGQSAMEYRRCTAEAGLVAAFKAVGIIFE